MGLFDRIKAGLSKTRNVFSGRMDELVENYKDLDDDFPYELINRGKDYKWPPRIDKELFWSCGAHTVWGISARIMKGFTDALHIR